MALKKIYGLKKIGNKEKKKILDIAKGSAALNGAGEISVVENPNYIYPRYSFYPLADKIQQPLAQLKGVVTDMDGTTTTTEVLCINSLEYMVRVMTGREEAIKWTGLDHLKDYPHIIGNSTTKHVEYLLKAYGKFIRPLFVKRSFINAGVWTLVAGQDENRRREVSNNIQVFGAAGLLKEPLVLALQKHRQVTAEAARRVAKKLEKRYLLKLKITTQNDLVRAGVDIYYQRYHYILGKIDQGKGKTIRKSLGLTRHLIEPMPGIGIYLSLLRGWLGKDLVKFYPYLEAHLLSNRYLRYSKKYLSTCKKNLGQIGAYYAKNPVPIAIVTSSIEYEARIVLNEVFKEIRRQIAEWPLSAGKKEKLKKYFSDYKNIYNGFITASDSSEIRLKPHRDLFSLALHQLGIGPRDFKYVIGFEDSESGLLAIRAAGIGKSIAVPFTDTLGHDLSSANIILYGGIPEAILIHRTFVKI
ncbi:MAG: hypothetical protein WCV50_03915 [Patescibacteria group bacterium]|jgi:hypothetical protein